MGTSVKRERKPVYSGILRGAPGTLLKMVSCNVNAMEDAGIREPKRAKNSSPAVEKARFR